MLWVGTEPAVKGIACEVVASDIDGAIGS